MGHGQRDPPAASVPEERNFSLPRDPSAGMSGPRRFSAGEGARRAVPAGGSPAPEGARARSAPPGRKGALGSCCCPLPGPWGEPRSRRQAGGEPGKQGCSGES